MLVAFAALLLAMGAPSYAAQTFKSIFFAKHAGNADKVDGFKASGKPKANTLLALDSHGKFPASVGVAGPQGPEGVVGPQGGLGPQGLAGPQGNRGATGAPGSALAYGVIEWRTPDDGGPQQWIIDDNSSKNLDGTANFTEPSAGVYCFYSVGYTVTNAVATPGPFSGTSFLVQAQVSPPASSGCPSNSVAAIYATDLTGKPGDPPSHSDTIYFELN